MNVFILTEGGLHIGFGHITRCLAIYDAFYEKKINPIMIINGDKTIDHLLRSNIRRMVVNWVYESEALLDYIGNADIVVVDSYLADEKLYKKISKKVKTPLYFDDNLRINYPRGIVINGNIYAEELNYPQRKDIKYLLGSKYIPLRKEFWEVPEKKIRKNIETIMITFGGNDVMNLTPWVLKILNLNFPEFRKKVVIGDAFKNKHYKEGFKDKKTELIICPDAKKIKEIMLESDLAISSGGQTLYELARVGVPTIAILTANNQILNIRGLHKAGLIKRNEMWDSDGLIKELEALNNKDIRLKKVQVARELVDGFGARRIVEYSLRSYFKNSIILREAELKDMYGVYKLSNEREVRKNSFNQGKIELKHHRNWFARKLKEKDSLFLIAELNNNFAGYIRFDISCNEAIISICITKDHRGFGIGEIVIKRALKYLNSIKPEIKTIKAYIKEENIASKRLFEKAHFEFLNKCTIKNHNASVYIYRF